MQIPIVNHSHHPLPTYATLGASGMDIRAFIPASITLLPLERVLIHTGVSIALPFGYEAQVRPRSGLAYHHGITVLNSPGTIDSDFRGEIKILLINLGDKPFEIEDGDRIAQLVVAGYTSITWESMSTLPETARGCQGHGSTGRN